MPTGTSGGWNKPKQPQGGSGASPLGSRPKHPLLKGLIAGAVVVLVALGAVYFFMLDSKPKVEVKESTKPRRIKEVTPAPARTNKVEVVQKTDKKILGKTPTGEDYVSVEVTTNGAGALIERFVLADGTRKRVIHLQTKESRYFDHEIDNTLWIIASTPLDQELPPFPEWNEDLDAQFERAIETPIIIGKDDDEKRREAKKLVIEVRKEICDMKREGYTLKQILAEHNSLRKTNIELRGEFQRELTRLYRSGDIDGAQQYMTTMNEALTAKGILPLKLPTQGKKGQRKQ